MSMNQKGFINIVIAIIIIIIAAAGFFIYQRRASARQIRRLPIKENKTLFRKILLLYRLSQLRLRLRLRLRLLPSPLHLPINT